MDIISQWTHLINVNCHSATCYYKIQILNKQQLNICVLDVSIGRFCSINRGKKEIMSTKKLKLD